MAAGDEYLMRIKYLNQGVECFNIMHYEQKITDGGDASNLVAAFLADLSSEIRACLHNTCILYSVEALNLNDDTDDSLAIINAAGTGDTTAGRSLPTFCTMVIEKVSPTRAIRSGAMRLPGTPENFSTGNELELPAGAPLNTLAAALPTITDPAGDPTSFDLQIYTRPNATYPSGTFTQVDQCVVKGVSYQQTRKS